MSNPPPLIIANLKANKTWDETAAWLDQVGKNLATFGGTAIVCPATAFLAAASLHINTEKYPLKLGTQDLSQFEQGPHTGEVAASQLAGLCEYVIIGHSERREKFAETDEVVGRKLGNALAAGITPIVCVQDKNVLIPQGAQIVAYEPTFAVGTGHPDTPENVASIAAAIKQKGPLTVIYGGSVTAQNAASFLKKDLVEGLLVGGASLDPWDFLDITKSSHI